MKPLNKALLKIGRRAENKTQDEIIKSYVDVGSAFDSIDIDDHQIIYGRRGTGKTHILEYLATQKREMGEVAITIDMRTIGSCGGIYDEKLPLYERATRLLQDTLKVLHRELRNLADKDVIDLSKIANALDALITSVNEVVVEETVEIESTLDSDIKLNSSINVKGMSLNVGIGNEQNDHIFEKIYSKGSKALQINLGSVQSELKNITDFLPNNKLMVFLDEWSGIPLDLQPYLADMLARAAFPVRGITIKIAAIRQRTQFRIVSGRKTLGFEPGADISAGVDLDEDLVFDNNRDAAKVFFQELLWRHIKAINKNENLADSLGSSQKFVQDVFTQITAFDELVRAAEGNPRDAINIVVIAAKEAKSEKISVKNIRDSALRWYHDTKQASLSSKPIAIQLLNWTIEEVIRGKKARAFLLAIEVKDEVIDFLYDERAIHLIKRNVSANDEPGKKFNVYCLDYGLYVDLINTKSEVQYDLFSEINDIDVPATDYRSVRSAVLNINEFYQSNTRP